MEEHMCIILHTHPEFHIQTELGRNPVRSSGERSSHEYRPGQPFQYLCNVWAMTPNISAGWALQEVSAWGHQFASPFHTNTKTGWLKDSFKLMGANYWCSNCYHIINTLHSTKVTHGYILWKGKQEVSVCLSVCTCMHLCMRITPNWFYWFRWQFFRTVI